MSNMILIRGNKIAFSRRGTYTDSDNDFAVNDLRATMFNDGWFLPVIGSGMQAAYMLDSDQFVDPHRRADHGAGMGMKGLLVTVKHNGAHYHSVEFNAQRQVILTPYYTGEEGFAVVTPYPHLADMMTMCVQLTKTIEDAVDMYFRHVPGNRSSFNIWDETQVKEFLRKYHLPAATDKIVGLAEVVDNAIGA